MTLKNSIIALRKEGKTYKEISIILHCSEGTVSYHCSLDGKKKAKTRNNRNYLLKLRALKIKHGGKCCKCGYNRSFNALEFHHINEKEKIASISDILRSKGFKNVEEEAKKCILVCSNCHREIHDKMVGMGGVEPHI